MSFAGAEPRELVATRERSSAHREGRGNDRDDSSRAKALPEC
jgi:hypothetical protein